ncbi:MAG: N-acetylneuraminate synthase family protein [Nitrospirae bacterium]|nr:N-acetylneuraminate synthase family protein [Nitrospirota bacterium]
MNIGVHNLTEKVFVIAEIGANHEGNLDEAKRLIEAAATCGADAVKFQTYRADKIVAASETQRRAHFRRLELTDDAFQTLAHVALEYGVMFLSTPFDVESVDLLDPLMPAFKIASGDLTAAPLVAHIAGKGKPILLSTGMADMEEIFDAVEVIERASPCGAGAPLVLLHCVSSYPTPDASANLNAIPYLRDRTGRLIGYSDHTLGVEACLAAVALGARVIEKHFTSDKTRTTMRDHQLSADPADLAHLVKGIRRVEAMLGETGKALREVEAQNRVSMRRSLAARTAIHKGEVITPAMLTVLRPGTGLPPSKMHEVIGLRAMKDLVPGELLTQDALTEMESCAT